MRPIDQDNRDFAYSSADALAREVVVFAPAEKVEAGDGEGAGAEQAELPPRAEKSTVGAQVEKLETLLASSWDPAGRWAGEEDAAAAARLLELIGDGYAAALGDLIDQCGPYCAYCEAAEPAASAPIR